MTLLPYTNDCAVKIAGWPSTAEETRAWAGAGAHIPLGPVDIGLWHADPDVHPFVARRGGYLIAYGELWIDYSEQEVELGRIIVNPSCRGEGVGRAFVSALLERAFTFEFSIVFVRVVPGNTIALRCYRAAGFDVATSDEQREFNKGQPIQYVWLNYRR